MKKISNIIVVATIVMFSASLFVSCSRSEKIYEKGVEYSNQGNSKEAAMCWHKAAKRGNTDAMFLLGWCFMNGFGVEENKEEAVKWYRKAAKKGNADAQRMLGYFYTEGYGVEKK